MCGCMPALAGLFNHHLPLLRSIGSFFSSRTNGFSLLKPSTRPGSNSAKRLATKDITLTLGSRVDGNRCFLRPTSVFAREEDWLRLGQMAYNPPGLDCKPSRATRREWYEDVAEQKRHSIEKKRQSLSSHPPTLSLPPSRKPSVRTHVRSLPRQDEEADLPRRTFPSDRLT